ncbi:hypothetical protein K466DRAFT_605186 [Polyporus arcularius HHB13444]|uniref:Uncharacterized protein n=1 Tax=Polyporus arcularius HHB13444 TaxID=1314778 RepID=A0A5C3NV04_9APHY|nr:hypothetical protein K466DRAFT_605186 [Polyporus arcularius HHB13444]
MPQLSFISLTPSYSESMMTSIPPPSYTRMLSNALVFGNHGGEPMAARAHAVLAHGSTHRWFMIEFPHGHATEFPFPTFEVNGCTRMVVFQLPLDFEFTYCDLTRACRWSVKDCDFSLVLSQQADYAYIRNTVAGSEEGDRDIPDGSPAVLLDSNIGNVLAVVNEIVAATRDPAGVTVRGYGSEGSQGSAITFRITLTGH